MYDYIQCKTLEVLTSYKSLNMARSAVTDNEEYAVNLQTEFPNVCFVLRVYPTLPVSNCIGKRYFSHLV